VLKYGENLWVEGISFSLFLTLNAKIIGIRDEKLQ
jgi:hypothetical protein